MGIDINFLCRNIQNGTFTNGSFSDIYLKLLCPLVSAKNSTTGQEIQEMVQQAHRTINITQPLFDELNVTYHKVALLDAENTKLSSISNPLQAMSIILAIFAGIALVAAAMDCYYIRKQRAYTQL